MIMSMMAIFLCLSMGFQIYHMFILEKAIFSRMNVTIDMGQTGTI